MFVAILYDLQDLGAIFLITDLDFLTICIPRPYAICCYFLAALFTVADDYIMLGNTNISLQSMISLQSPATFYKYHFTYCCIYTQCLVSRVLITISCSALDQRFMVNSKVYIIVWYCQQKSLKVRYIKFQYVNFILHITFVSWSKSQICQVL